MHDGRRGIDVAAIEGRADDLARDRKAEFDNERR